MGLKIATIQQKRLSFSVSLGQTKRCWVEYKNEEGSECHRTNQFFVTRNWAKIERQFKLIANQFDLKSNAREDRFLKLKVC